MAAQINQDGGGGAINLLGAGASVTLLGPAGEKGPGQVMAAVAATQPFNLYLLITPDNGLTWIIYKKIASAANDDALYTNSAEINQPVPFKCRLDLKNPGASTSNIVADCRFYNLNQS